MIRLFGGWENYRNAPTRVVQEQIIVWMARLKVESDQAKEQQRQIDEAKRG